VSGSALKNFGPEARASVARACFPDKLSKGRTSPRASPPRRYGSVPSFPTVLMQLGIEKRSKLAFGLVCSLLLAYGCGSRKPATGFQTFHSGGGPNQFTVRYPSSWHRLGHATDILTIVNFPPATWEPGFTLHDSQAMISVVPAPEAITSVENWIGKVGLHFELLSNREIPRPNPPPGSCTRLVEASWKVRVSPSAATIMTADYCSTDAGLFRIELTNLEANPNQAALQSIALHMALSFRSQ
jgi:hypothetical protein